MSLQKGFLRPKITLEVLNLDRKKLIFGILWWLALSFSIYSILYIFREGLRYTSFWWNGEDFLLLTAVENYFYNFIFAFLACTFAFTAISNQWLRRSSTLRNIPRYKKAAIFHDKVSFSWYFIYWFSKMGILFSVVSCSMGIFLKFSLFPHYSSLLVLILLNVFFHQWLTLRLIFKNSVLPWMFGTFGMVALVSFVFAGVNLLPPKTFNESVLKNTIAHHLVINLPLLENGNRPRKRSLVTNIYVGFPRQHPDSIPQILVRNFYDAVNYITIGRLEEFIKKERSKVEEFEQNELTWRLNIDRHVKMKYVKKLKQEFGRNEIRQIQYASDDNDSNGLTSSLGLSQRIPNLNFKYPQFYREEQNEVIAELKIGKNQISFNDTIITAVAIRKVTRDFFLANGNLGVIELEVDNESTFEVYIGVCDQLVGMIKNLREEWTMKIYHMHYSTQEFYDSAQQHIHYLAIEQFPLNVVEKD